MRSRWSKPRFPLGTGDNAELSRVRPPQASDIHVTADHGGLAAGSEILVGYAESWVQAQRLSGGPDSARQAGEEEADEAGPAETRTDASLPSSLHPIPVGLQPQLTAGPYVFPVYGLDSSFTDTFGSFRGDVPGNWHHGDDIFAPLGTPILACAEGTVFSVGWNGVGGNRLWLRDGQGNEFYYAHLPAYSPAARNGQSRQGRRGGRLPSETPGMPKARPTNLHFEVHPVRLSRARLRRRR